MIHHDEEAVPPWEFLHGSSGRTSEAGGLSLLRREPGAGPSMSNSEEGA